MFRCVVFFCVAHWWTVKWRSKFDRWIAQAKEFELSAFKSKYNLDKIGIEMLLVSLWITLNLNITCPLSSEWTVWFIRELIQLLFFKINYPFVCVICEINKSLHRNFANWIYLLFNVLCLYNYCCVRQINESELQNDLIWKIIFNIEIFHFLYVIDEISIDWTWHSHTWYSKNALFNHSGSNNDLQQLPSIYYRLILIDSVHFNFAFHIFDSRSF